MDKLRLRNYRCLEDTGEIELKPITVLLGANSSGKSSFLKFFPLLKQSVGERVNGLFLWDGQYVDFKDFTNTVRNNVGDIEINYIIDRVKLNDTFDKVNIKNIDVHIVLGNGEDDKEYLKKVEISFPDVKAVYEFSDDHRTCSINVNGVKSSDIGDLIRCEKSKDLFPQIYFINEGNQVQISNIISAKAQMQYLNDLNIKYEANILYFELYGLFDRERIKQILLKLQKEKINDVEDSTINKVIYSNAGFILQIINIYFTRFAQQSTYILPLRSNMQRYYRLQNKDVEEIVPDGDNLALFINSLSKDELKEYNQWLSEVFKFSIKPNVSKGHIELLIKEGKKSAVNIIDAGFGYTQILPILTMIWNKSVKTVVKGDSSCNINTIAIEQPELHLHPYYQGLFVKLLAKALKESKGKVRLVLETHSEVIIRKLGELVEDGIIKNDDVNIVLFDAEKYGMKSYVHTTSFKPNGMLEKWPYGFFDEDSNAYTN